MNSIENEVGSSPKKYNMTHPKRGKCIIINIINYKNDQQRKREYSKKHVDLVKTVFQNKLDFEVDNYEDQTAKEIETLISSQASLDHSESDCFACFIMGHGEDGKIIAKDNQSVDIRTILDPIKKCKSLQGKPKLFFIQACRGENKEQEEKAVTNTNALVSDGDMTKSNSHVRDEIATMHEEYKSSTPLTNINIDETDLFIYNSTLSGRLAYGEIDKGTFFIQTMCTVFGKKSDTTSLSSMINEINRVVFERIAQQPEPIVLLRKEIYFIPKKKKQNGKQEKQDDDKVFLLVGLTGSGKSTLANCLYNKSGDLKGITESPFKTSNGATGCTRGFSACLKDGITVVDTIGFADSQFDHDTETNLKDMCKALESVHMRVDCILFVVKEGRFSKELITFFNEVQTKILKNKCINNSILLVTSRGDTIDWISEQKNDANVQQALANCNSLYYEFYLQFDKISDDDSDKKKNIDKRQKSIDDLVKFISGQSFKKIDLNYVKENLAEVALVKENAEKKRLEDENMRKDYQRLNEINKINEQKLADLEKKRSDDKQKLEENEKTRIRLQQKLDNKGDDEENFAALLKDNENVMRMLKEQIAHQDKLISNLNGEYVAEQPVRYFKWPK